MIVFSTKPNFCYQFTITLYSCYMKNCDPFIPAQNFILKFWDANLNFQNKDLAFFPQNFTCSNMHKPISYGKK